MVEAKMEQTTIHKTLISIEQTIPEILDEYNTFASEIQKQKPGYRELRLLKTEDLKIGVNLFKCRIENYRQWLILTALEPFENKYNCKIICKCLDINNIKKDLIENFDVKRIYKFLRFNEELLTHYIIADIYFNKYILKEIDNLHDLLVKQDCRTYHDTSQAGYINGEIYDYKKIEGLNFEYKYRIDTKELLLRFANIDNKKYTKDIINQDNIDNLLKRTIKNSIKHIGKTNPDLLLTILAKEVVNVN